MPHSTGTSSTLIERLRNTDDNEAWELFIRFYQPVILRFARTHGCDPDMCRDIAQETLVDLLSIMPRFAYDPDRGRFRSFLYEIVRRRVKAAFRQRRRYLTGSEEAQPGTPWPAPRDEPPEVTEEAWEREWQHQVVLEAMERLRQRVQPASFDAFHAYAVQGEDVDSICRRLALSANALYQIRHRLFATLKQITAEIEAEIEVPRHG